MKSLATLLCLSTLAWGLVPTASARDERLAALDQALARIETGPAVQSDVVADAVAARQLGNRRPPGLLSGIDVLKPLLAEFERRDAARRAVFDLVARKGLQGKAADRLAAARGAYARGQGRLLQILRRLTRGPKAAGTMAPAPEMGLVREAREIVAKVQEASRREPLSSGDLKLRAPRLQPPALPSREPGSTQATAAAASTAAAVPGLDDAAIGSIPKALRDAAAAFSGPIDTYEWVRNTIRPEFYYGGMKGPLQTYLEQSGNDADTASVLIALLRAKGIPARFVRGTVEWPAATLTEVTGTVTAEQGVRVLERAGVPHEAVLGAGGLSSVKLARVWAEAYLPYANYRGALLDSQGKGWISLDPGFKRLQAVTGLDVVNDLGFDPRAALDAYVSTLDNRTPLEFVRGRIGELLSGLKPGTTYADALNHRDLIPEALRVLPGSLPYPVVDRTDVSYALPDGLGHTVRIVGEADGLTVVDETFPVSDLLGRRFSLSYVPFAAEDRETADAFGGLAKTPPYLVDVKPVLKSAGVVVATGSAPLGMAVQYTLRIEFKTPGGTEVVTNTVLAGNLLAIGLGGAKVTGAESGEDQAAAILSARAWSYLDRWNRSDEELANLFRVVPVRPTVSECMAMSDVEVEYAGGDPKYPLTFDWKGIAIDADLRASAPVGVESRESERTFALISGLEGSILENKIFEDDLRIASVSTAKALQLANAQGIEVLNLTQANADSILPALPLDAGVKAEIREAVDRGLLARVPAREATYLAWTGVGYLLLDEGTGEAAYQLQGGHSGGVTAPAVFDMPADMVTLLQLQGEKPAPAGTEVAKVGKFPYGDFQFGTVHKILDTPLKVLATDIDGHPVPGAAVTFAVIGGEGGFPVDPSSADPEATVSETTVLSNDRGEAEVRLVLGRKTGLIPRYYLEDGKEFATQVGMNMVTARAGAAWLPDPFYAFGQPDTQSDGTNEHGTVWLKEYEQWWSWANLRLAGRITVEVTDQYENPLSNWAMTFSYKPAPTSWVPRPGWMVVRPANTTPGTLLTPKDFDACLAVDPDPKWGKCAGESGTATQETSAYGRASAYPFLGDSPTSTYLFHVGGPLAPQPLPVEFSTGGDICSPKPSCAASFAYPKEPVVTNGARLILGNRNRDIVEAYPPGQDGPLSFWADVLYEKERIDSYPDSNKNVHYYAVGINQWERKPLTNSDFKLAPTTPGTLVSPTQPGFDEEQGRYKATMTMGPQPQLNTVHWDATNAPDRIKYKDGQPPEVDLRDVNQADWTAKKAPDPKRPESRNADFSLWGVKAQVTASEPSPLFLTDGDSTGVETQIKYEILPPGYAAITDPLSVRLDINQGQNAILAAYGADAKPFTVPKGLGLKEGSYQAVLNVVGVSGDAKDIVSAPFTLKAVHPVDLVIDTENTTGLNVPLRTDQSEKDEDVAGDPTKPGKLVMVNLNDADLDNIPDFADGYGRDPAPNAADDDLNANDRFVPLVLRLADEVDIASIRLRFSYNASDPSQLQTRGVAPEVVYTPAPGHLRIWRRDANVPRNGAAVWASLPGDYVPPSVAIDPAQLGITAANRAVTLYVEGIEASAGIAGERLLALIDPDGTGPLDFFSGDAVRATAVKVDLHDTADNNRAIIGGYIAWIAAGGPATTQPPVMPQLQARLVPDLTGSVASDVKWSMKTTFTYRTRNDEVLIPPLPNGSPPGTPQPSLTRRLGEPLDIPAELRNLPTEHRWFGGNASLMMSVGSLVRQSLQFRIRGRNPDDGDARAFIDSNAGASVAWYAYAIPRHETRRGNGIYNQFEPGGANRGFPVWGTPDGWGLFQNEPISNGGSLPPTALWSWQDNAQRGLRKIDQDHLNAVNWMNSLAPQASGHYPRGQRPQSRIDFSGAQYNAATQTITGGPQWPIAPDPLAVGGCVFGDRGGHPFEDAVAIKMFHGAPSNYFAWHGPPTNTWARNNTVTVFVDGQPVVVDYVAEVCVEVGQQP